MLRKRADILFSRYIRLRDSDLMDDGSRVGYCIDECGKRIVVKDTEGKWTKQANIGHFITRGYLGLRFDEENCHLQYSWCNAWRDKDSMLRGYAKGLDMKCGRGTATKLRKQSKLPYTLTREDLEQIIHDAKESIDWYESGYTKVVN